MAFTESVEAAFRQGNGEQSKAVATNVFAIAITSRKMTLFVYVQTCIFSLQYYLLS